MAERVGFSATGNNVKEEIGEARRKREVRGWFPPVRSGGEGGERGDELKVRGRIARCGNGGRWESLFFCAREMERDLYTGE